MNKDRMTCRFCGGETTPPIPCCLRCYKENPEAAAFANAFPVGGRAIPQQLRVLLLDVKHALIEEQSAIADDEHPRSKKLTALIERIERTLRKES